MVYNTVADRRSNVDRRLILAPVQSESAEICQIHYPITVEVNDRDDRRPPDIKEDERPVKSPTNTQIKKLLSPSKPYQTMRMRILLALGTGLRPGGIESLKVSNIDFENSYVSTRSKKTRKGMGSRPVPVPIMAELRKYIFGLDPK